MWNGMRIKEAEPALNGRDVTNGGRLGYFEPRMLCSRPGAW